MTNEIVGPNFSYLLFCMHGLYAWKPQLSALSSTCMCVAGGGCRRPEKHRFKFEVPVTCPSNHMLLTFYYPMKMTNIYILLLMW